MVTKGRFSSHQHTRTFSNKIFHHVNLSNKESLFSSHSGRQQDCSIIPSQNGRSSIINYDENSKGNLEFFFGKGDHTYGRVPSGYSECRRRFGVKKSEKLIEMETEHTHFQRTLSVTRDPKDRCVCIKTDKSTAGLLLLETRPLLCWNRCISTELATGSDLSLIHI